MEELNGSVVLFSGGQDSTTCLLQELSQSRSVHTIGFRYGQRHEVEIACREKILRLIRAEQPHLGERLGKDVLIDVPALEKLSPNALTGPGSTRSVESGLPSTFVPGRNLLFLCYAAALAYEQKVQTIVLGVSQTDYSGYPDCRKDTMQSMEQSLSLGLDWPVRLKTPLMFLSKAETWQLAYEVCGLWGVKLVRSETHSCYEGVRSSLHQWGYGCGVCASCVLRRKGWDEFCEKHPKICSAL